MVPFLSEPPPGGTSLSLPGTQGMIPDSVLPSQGCSSPVTEFPAMLKCLGRGEGAEAAAAPQCHHLNLFLSVGHFSPHIQENGECKVPWGDDRRPTRLCPKCDPIFCINGLFWLRNEFARWQKEEMNKSSMAHLQLCRANSIPAQPGGKRTALGQNWARKGDISKNNPQECFCYTPCEKI